MQWTFLLQPAHTFHSSVGLRPLTGKLPGGSDSQLANAYGRTDGQTDISAPSFQRDEQEAGIGRWKFIHAHSRENFIIEGEG